MLGFHMMNIWLWNQTARPPNTTIIEVLTHSIRSILRPTALFHANCSSVATITTAVASSAGASVEPTTPPWTTPPSQCVAKAAPWSGIFPAILYVAKKKISGRISKRSFMVGGPPGARGRARTPACGRRGGAAVRRAPRSGACRGRSLAQARVGGRRGSGSGRARHLDAARPVRRQRGVALVAGLLVVRAAQQLVQRAHLRE